MFPDRNLNPPSAGTIAQSPAKSRSPLDTPNELLPKPRSVEGKSSVLNWARTKRCIILLGISVVTTFAWSVRVITAGQQGALDVAAHTAVPSAGDQIKHHRLID